MSDKVADRIVFIVFLIFIATIICGAVGWKWYASGVQVEVYHREGVTITQWECFVGAKPAERVFINGVPK